MMTPAWPPLRLDPASLGGERRQLHHAALVLASTAHSLLPHAADDSHTNFAVIGEGAALATRRLRRDAEVRCTLAARELELRWQHGDEVIDRLTLAGRTVADALAWTDATARRQCGAGVQPRSYDDLEPHPLGAGEPFASGDAAARAELGRWFGAAARLLAEFGMREPRLSPQRVWPHHFDLGALLPVSVAAGEATIGLGFSPGDASYDQPYFYCSPYPLGDAELPPLSGPGRWHTDDFTSVVITGGELLASGDPSRTARAWLDSAVAACRQVLGG